MSKVSYAYAVFLGTFLECVMYGIFFVLFIAACYVQWEKFSKRREVNHVMAFTTVFMGSTITTNCVLSLYRAIRAIFYVPPGVTVYQFLDPPYDTAEIARWGVFQFQIVVADAVMMYRMYHIYNKNLLVCVIPSITITGLFAVGCGLTNRLRDLTTPRKLKELDDWSTACFCLAIFNSLFMTLAISSRLWRVHRETTRASIQLKGSAVLRAMIALIESAALWTTFVTMNFFIFLAGSKLTYTFLLVISPVIGISFCLIIVRLGHVLPKARSESWRMSIRTPGSRTTGSDKVGVSFTQLKVRRDVFVSESTDTPTGTMESHKQEYVNPSDDLPGVIRASLDLSTAV
ncbi:hypothetical protein BDM02DRAFT_3121771 [Thelephora ganbajun]|uniref:Uncharacterized protein n=1 Tax=Thelephora ganbajun TaxID=370292 RepID=A0ACB6Z4G9_THEGA|nr:hypothetical protein BDM02DRAFT_3121771 [Thelephora ganbajun]